HFPYKLSPSLIAGCAASHSCQWIACPRTWRKPSRCRSFLSARGLIAGDWKSSNHRETGCVNSRLGTACARSFIDGILAPEKNHRISPVSRPFGRTLSKRRAFYAPIVDIPVRTFLLLDHLFSPLARVSGWCISQDCYYRVDS